MTEIEDIAIRKILDSRGNPTVEVEVQTESGFGTTAAPSGASTGIHEVKAWPDEGIDAAIEHFIMKVAPELMCYDALQQEEIDLLLRELDGTDDFSKMGGNVAVATSLAVAKAAADSLGLPLHAYLGGVLANSLPYPLGNVLGGGRHAIGGTDIQEFLVISLGPTFADSAFANAAVHKRVKEKLKAKLPESSIGKGDEGAWVAKIGNIEALELVAESCKEISDDVGFDIKPSLDMAASEFYRDGKYHYSEQTLDTEGQINFVAEIAEKYDLYIVEDPLDQEDFEGYAKLTKEIGSRSLIVGDDLFVTNSSRLLRGIEMGAANAVLIKPNQIGTLTDTHETVSLAHEFGYKTVISHRSGETTDDSIAHLAVAFGCFAIKTGAVGGERTAKLNELMRIEEYL